MKQSVIQTIGKSILFVIISAATTLGSHAQEADPAILNMMPEIPADIREPAARAVYLSLHFWDKFNFSDTSFLMKDHLLERCFVDYLDILSLVSSETISESVHILLTKSANEKVLFSYLFNLSEKYLYEPASPVCDEEKLLPFLQYALQSPLLNDTEKIRPKFLLENVSKNRRGHAASDFTYTLMNGDTGNLYAINADYTLLYFNDPECEDCLMLTKQLNTSPVIKNLIGQNKLKILTVYVNDDLEAWEKHASDISDTWIYSRDAALKINMEGIYNIKQFPTLYLLDKDKKVLQKEVTFEMLEEFFNVSNF